MDQIYDRRSLFVKDCQFSLVYFLHPYHVENTWSEMQGQEATAAAINTFAAGVRIYHT